VDWHEWATKSDSNSYSLSSNLPLGESTSFSGGEAGDELSRRIGSVGESGTASLPRFVEADIGMGLDVNTMPEATLKALANHNELGSILPVDGGDCEEVLAQFAKAGIAVDALAAQLQDEGAKSFVKSCNELMAVTSSKTAVLSKTAGK